MGLMYQFPTHKDDIQHVEENTNSIKLRSYGLPPIFWAYGAAILTFIIVLIIFIKGPVEKLLSFDDQINNLIGYSLISFLTLLPASLISFFFYEKNFVATKGNLKIIHKLFFIPIRTIEYNTADRPLDILHFFDSPNMARINKQDQMSGFENKGHFLLQLKTSEGKFIIIDRSSRKADLTKVVALLQEKLL